MNSQRVIQISTVDFTLTRQLPGLLREIKDAGLELTCISATPRDPSFFARIGVGHIPLRLTRRFTPLTDLMVLFKLFLLFLRKRPSIVHTHTPKANLLGQLAAFLARVPVRIATIHGFYFTSETPYLRRRLLILMERWSVKWSQLLFLVNAEDCENAVRLRIGRPGKVQYLAGGNGIDLARYRRGTVSEDEKRELRRELSIENGAPVVGFVGRLVEEKGLRDLLRAAEIVSARDPNVVFLIVGPVDAEKHDAFDPASVSARSVAAGCRFTGFRDDTPRLYAIMDVFVLPSYREGLPMSLMEASAMGVPSVVTNVRGSRDIVEHEKSGLVVPVHRPDELAGAIERLLQDRQLARRLGECAERTALDRFDDRKSAERILIEYWRLAGSRLTRPERSVALRGEHPPITVRPDPAAG